MTEEGSTAVEPPDGFEESLDDNHHPLIYFLRNASEWLTYLIVLVVIVAVVVKFFPDFGKGLDLNFYAIVAQVVPVFVLVFVVDQRRIVGSVVEPWVEMRRRVRDMRAKNPDDPDLEGLDNGLMVGYRGALGIKDATSERANRVCRNAMFAEVAALYVVATGDPSAVALVVCGLCGFSVMAETISGALITIETKTR